MIVTPRFVFLHLHKSGGTFANVCLLQFVPDARQIGYHLPRELIPAAFSALPVLGLVRNPWSYYVSWYAFQSSRPEPNALYRALSNNGTLGFAGTVRNMLLLGRDDSILQKVLSVLPPSYTNRGLNLPAFALETIRGSGLGFYSFLHRHIFGTRTEDLIIGRMESLREELPSMLERAGQPVSPPMHAFITESAALNASAHAEYSTYYDASLAKEVATADESVVARYGYGLRPAQMRDGPHPPRTPRGE